MPFALACGHERPVADGRFEVARFRIRRRGFLCQLGPRPALPVRLYRQRTPAGERSIRCCAVENVQTCKRSCVVVNSCIQIPTRARACGESPAGRRSCPCCGHRRVSHRSRGSGPSSGAMVRSHARRGRRTAPRSHSKTCSRNSGKSRHFGLHADTSFKSPHRNSGGTGRVAWSVTNLSCARRPQTRLICELRGEGSDDGHQQANKEKVMVGFSEPHGHAPRTSLRY
jgi:hypothetical protein